MDDIDKARLFAVTWFSQTILRSAAAIALAVQAVFDKSDDDFTSKSDEFDGDVTSKFDDVDSDSDGDIASAASASDEDFTSDVSDDVTNDSNDDVSSDRDDDIDASTSPPYWNDDRVLAWLDTQVASLPDDVLIDKTDHFQNFPAQHNQTRTSAPPPPKMSKRKRASTSPSPDTSSRTLKTQTRLCNRCLADAKKSLVAALRLGAGFERQKHSRRKKTAQAKHDTKALERLDAEYTVLKGLDLDKVADQHLRKTVGRVKSLKDQDALRSYVGGIEKGNGEAATLNVLARLYKVAAVKKVVDEAVEGLKGVLAKAEGGEKKAKKVGSEDVDRLDVSDEGGDPYEVFSARIAAPSSGEEGSEGSVSGDERPPSIGDSDSEHDPEDDLGAESEESAFEGFSGDEDEASDDDDVAIDRRIAPPSDLSDSESDEPTAKRKSKTKAHPAQPTSSAFIPSLSHAAYVAGSDSEASDLSADFAPRKNRRGQRARQKIAEAKFGAKAKHLEKVDRNSGWDAKRGAVGERRRYGPLQSGENAIPLGGGKKKELKKRDDKGELHPSWQAAKLAKEKKQIKIDVKASAGQGKKVVFD